MTFSELAPLEKVDLGLSQRRQRSAGLLTPEEIADAGKDGTELAYDPVQHGIVRLDCIDDIAGSEEPVRGRPSDRGAASLAFRRWRFDDAGVFAAFLSESDIWRFLPDKPPGKLDHSTADDLIRFSNDAGHHDVYAVEVGGEVVGQARLLFDPMRPGDGDAEISYWLGKPHWGKGLGSRIVAAFTSESFVRWQRLTSIFARVHRDHHASQRVLTKAGFVTDPRGTTADWLIFRKLRA